MPRWPKKQKTVPQALEAAVSAAVDAVDSGAMTAQEGIGAAIEVPPAPALTVAPLHALDGSPMPSLPALTAMALEWLGDRQPASVSYRDSVLTVVSHPDAQKKRFWEGM